MNPKFPPAVIGRSSSSILRNLARTHFHQPAICLFRALELTELRDFEFSAPILDLGCGNGDIGDLVLRSHWPVIGMDLLRSEVRAAVRREVYEGLAVADGAFLPFSDRAFGTVISICVMEHISNDRDVLAEVARVLQPGGLYIFTTPSEHFESQLIHSEDPAVVASVNRRLGHFHYRSAEEWSDLLGNYGLQSIEHRFFLPAATQRLWQRLDTLMVKQVGSRRILDLIRGLHRRGLLPLGLWSWFWSISLANWLERVSEGEVGGGQLIVACKPADPLSLTPDG